MRFNALDRLVENAPNLPGPHSPPRLTSSPAEQPTRFDLVINVKAALGEHADECCKKSTSLRNETALVDAITTTDLSAPSPVGD